MTVCSVTVHVSSCLMNVYPGGFCLNAELSGWLKMLTGSRLYAQMNKMIHLSLQCG